MGLFSTKKDDKNGSALPNKKSSKDGKELLKRSKTLFIFASICAIATFVSVSILLSQTISQTSYYVLNQNVTARSQIDASMLTEVRTTTGAQPRNSLDLGDVQTGEVYAKYSLETGDVLSPSNAGPLNPINEGIPENFVTMSFTLPAEQAVAGNVKRGDYIDVISTSGEATDSSSQARYALRHVLVIDVLATPKTLTDGENTEGGGDDGSGVASLYTVAVSEKDAATLALVQATNFHVVLSSVQGAENPEDIRSTGDDVFGNNPVGDSGEGTSPSFDGEQAPSAEGEQTPPAEGEQTPPAEEEPVVPEVPSVPQD